MESFLVSALFPPCFSLPHLWGLGFSRIWGLPSLKITMCFSFNASWTLFSLSSLCPYFWGFPLLQQGRKTLNIFGRMKSCCIILHCLSELGSFLSTWDAYAQIWGKTHGYEFLVLWFISGMKMCQSKVQITSAWRVDGGRREDLFYIQIHVGYSWAGYKLRKRQDTRWENAWVMEGEGSWLPWAGTIRWCYLKCVGKEKKRGVVGFNSKSAKKKKKVLVEKGSWIP